MAEMKFSVLAVVPSLQDQSIFIKCSMDIEESSVDNNNIYVLNNKTKHIAPVNVIVDRNIIQLQFREWVIPGDEYLVITDTGIESITEVKLDLAMMRRVTFKSDVVSEVEITSPANFEACEGTIELKWKEISKKKFEKAFYLEVASDNNFYNILYRIYVDEDKYKAEGEHEYRLLLKEVTDNSQYYIRMRAQRELNALNYGNWSQKITFTKKGLVEETPQTDSLKDTDATPEVVGNAIEFVDRIEPTKKETTSDGISYNLEYERYADPLPDYFSIEFPYDVDISDIKVKIVREDI